MRVKPSLQKLTEALPAESRDVVMRLFKEIQTHRLVHDALLSELQTMERRLTVAVPLPHHERVRNNLDRCRKILELVRVESVDEPAAILAGLAYLTDDIASDPEFEDAERTRQDTRVLDALETYFLSDRTLGVA